MSQQSVVALRYKRQLLACEPGVPRDVVAKLVNVVIDKTSRTTTSII